ncbi:MAG: CotH kinase family protein [Clostridia bacterium]|nr:CotH kinase family protein [Clostridia bacterium]
MLKTKTMDRVCCAATALMLVLSLALWGVVESVRGDGSHTVGYESLLFDQSVVHTIDITMDGWDDFIANATAEEYTDCNITIDGEKYNHVAIRAKGNTSLSSVATLGSERYSFKVEFDHFVEGMTYHGLDKLSLNNMIQDATMMKDYLAYTLMNKMGVPSSLCSYVQITVNGEPWGLYLAVEGLEDAFMERNGMTKGELYKPDSLSFGGGRGNGRDFDMEQFRVKDDEETDAKATETPAADATAAPEAEATTAPSQSNGMPFGNFPGMPGSGSDGGSMPQMPGGNGGFPDMSGGNFSFPGGGEGFSMPENMPSMGEAPGGDFAPSSMFGGGGGGFGGFNFGMGSDDVKLVYTDDDFDSYSNIFNNAKTDVSKKDKARLIESLRKLNAKEDLDEVVNKDEVITYLTVHNFLCNDDSYTGMMVHNYYLYEGNGKLSILPWDYNLAFGGFSASGSATSTVNAPIDSPVSSGTTDSRPLIAWIFSDEDALAQYHETYSRFIAECIESGWLESEIARVQTMISPYVEEDPSAFYTMDEFNKAVETLQTFCAKRGESVRGQLDGTIPSTSSEQRSSSALIDASEISTADMGSMNSSQGGGMTMPGGGGGGGFTRPGSSDSSGESNSGSGGFSMPSGGFTMPSGDSSGSFTKPEGMPDMGSFSPGSMPGTDATAQPEQTAPTDSATAQPEESTTADGATEKPSRESRGGFSRESGMPGNMPGGMSFPGGFEQQADQTGLWIQVAVCAAALIAAILVIMKARNHNQ